MSGQARRLEQLIRFTTTSNWILEKFAKMSKLVVVRLRITVGSVNGGALYGCRTSNFSAVAERGVQSSILCAEVGYVPERNRFEQQADES